MTTVTTPIAPADPIVDPADDPTPEKIDDQPAFLEPMDEIAVRMEDDDPFDDEDEDDPFEDDEEDDDDEDLFDDEDDDNDEPFSLNLDGDDEDEDEL